MYLAPNILAFINQEAACGRNWRPGYNTGANDLYFSPIPGCTNPAEQWQHLHLSYTYQDTLHYLGGKVSILHSIHLYKHGRWNIQAITRFPRPMQLAIISVQIFWTPPPTR
ncbi:hypothetical protein ABLB69_05165 [Xenorhabdus khoisanae]|uniref:Uncharacterized protein n=1 Tax=Xenorhabdus khoisanae TaxID=880157 RepID=A0A0J5FTK5_9GAMM|nr:hypothetical protein [Xenorhabdus khoisanae]KMJ45601.1 hypothetical protein AB204_08230 [Xenorhabdus khoisanae]MDC9615347.1 hypothetical protein [Xenorhabdus khoisanae]